MTSPSVALNPDLTPEELARYLRRPATYRRALENPVLPLLALESPDLANAVKEAKGRQFKDEVKEQTEKLGPRQIQSLAAKWRGRLHRVANPRDADRFRSATTRADVLAGRARKPGYDDATRKYFLLMARNEIFLAFALLWSGDTERDGVLYDEICEARGAEPPAKKEDHV
jgi:hypothetical protein